MADVLDRVIAEYSRQCDLRTTRDTYRHDYVAEKRDAIAKLGASMDCILNRTERRSS